MVRATGESLPAGERVVYFVQAGDDGPIKIGSTGNPRHRLAMLQSAHYDLLTMLGTCGGGFAREYALHEELAAHRIRGEWFAPAPEVLAVVAACIAEDPEDWEAQEMTRMWGGWLAYPPSERRSRTVEDTVSTGESSAVADDGGVRWEDLWEPEP